MRDISLNWDWLGGLPTTRTRPARHEETRASVSPDGASAPEPFPSAVDIRMASGSVVRISFDQTTRRMSFGRVRG
jgi:hypothetical protein